MTEVVRVKRKATGRRENERKENENRQNERRSEERKKRESRNTDVNNKLRKLVRQQNVRCNDCVKNVVIWVVMIKGRRGEVEWIHRFVESSVVEREADVMIGRDVMIIAVVEPLMKFVAVRIGFDKHLYIKFRYIITLLHTHNDTTHTRGR